MPQPSSILAYSNPQDLVFGQCLRPVSCGFDLSIGAGMVFPEVNFTLPIIDVAAENWSGCTHYDEIGRNIVLMDGFFSLASSGRFS